MDATRLAEGLFASHMAVNIFLLGVAYQGGLIPISGGVDRGSHPAEPRGGRAQPAGVPVGPQVLSGRARGGGAAGAARPPADDRTAWSSAAPPTWSAIRIARMPSVTATFVREVEARQPALAEDGGAQSVQADGVQGRVRSGAPADAIPSCEAQIREMWEEVESIGYNLHPPLLRALGMKKKLKLGSWFRGPLRMLASLKGLRGTPFDPFGYAEVRREERALIDWYEQLVRECLDLHDAGQPGAGAGDRGAARTDSRLRKIKLDSIRKVKALAAEKLSAHEDEARAGLLTLRVLGTRDVHDLRDRPIKRATNAGGLRGFGLRLRPTPRRPRPCCARCPGRNSWRLPP